MKRFKVTSTHKGKKVTVVTTVDDENACLLRANAWRVMWGHAEIPYIYRYGTGKVCIYLHHVIFGDKGADARYIYHQNGDSLDNRKANLALTPPKPPEGQVRYSDAMRVLNRLITNKPTTAAPHADPA